MLEFIKTDSNDPTFRALIDLLDIELNERYNRPLDFKNNLNEVPYSETVILVKKENMYVACGCFKEYDEQTVELKRIFVKKAYRSQGISKYLVSALEDWSKSLNYTRIILETGVNQPEAISLYKTLGYEIIENFSPYVGHQLSICMQK